MSLLGRLGQLWHRVTHVGVDPALPRGETKHIVLTNQYALFVAFCGVLTTVGPSAHTLLPEVRAWLALSLAMNVVVLTLNALRRDVLASALLIATFTVVMAAVGTLEPVEALHEPFLVLNVLASWFVFPRRVHPTKTLLLWALLVAVMAGVYALVRE